MLNSRTLILTFGMLCSSVAAYAVPAKPGQWRTITLADGTEVRAELRGDEFCHYWLADDGSAYLPNATDGRFEPIDLQSTEISGRTARRLANVARADRAAAANPGKYTGKKRGLIILVEFPKRTATNTPEATFSTTDAQIYYDRVANGGHPLAAKTHCKHGHEFTPDNIYWTGGGRHRHCKRCTLNRNAKYKAAKRAA